MTAASRIPKAVGRSVKEWFGKTPDSKCPQHVLLRIFDREGGVCFITGRKIKPGDEWEGHHCDELGRGLEEGCENREKNIHPALIDPHKAETAKQRKRKAKSDAVRSKHIGISAAPIRPIQSRPFPKSEKQAKREAGTKDRLPVPQRREGYLGCFKIGDK